MNVDESERSLFRTLRVAESDIARPAVTHAAAAGTASGLNGVLLAAAAFAALGAIAGFAFGPDPARQPLPIPAPGELSARLARAEHEPLRD